MTAHPQLALLLSRARYEERQIMAALECHGVAYEQVDTRTLHGGLADRRWPVVLDREIGSVRARYAAWTLEAEGSRVLNSAATIDLCSDKWRTSLALRSAGVTTPRTLLALTPEATMAALDELGYPAVIKPVSGSWGRLVSKLENRTEAGTVLEYVGALTGPQAHLGYVQSFVPSNNRNIRVIVINGEALGASYQLSDGWRTNIAWGGECVRCELSTELAKLAISAAEAVGAELAGVDIVEDPDGRHWVLEVNAGVEFTGFNKAHPELNVADYIVDYVESVLADAC